MNAVDDCGANSLFFPLLPFNDAVQQQQQQLVQQSRASVATPPQAGINRQSVQLASMPPIGAGAQAVGTGAAVAGGGVISRGTLTAASGALPAAFQALRTQLQSVGEKLTPTPAQSTGDANVPVGQALTSGGMTLNVLPSAQPVPVNFADEALPTAVLVMAYLIKHGANWHHKNKDGVCFCKITYFRATCRSSSLYPFPSHSLLTSEYIYNSHFPY